MPRLGAALAVLEHGPKDKGLAMFVSTKRIAVFGSRFAPLARASVGMSSLSRPARRVAAISSFRALVMGGGRPRVLEGWAGHLHEVDCAYPELAGSGLDGAKVLLADRVSRTTEFPLAVIGPGRLLEMWRERSRHPSLLIGTVQSDRADVSADRIAKMAQPLITLWREAVATVETAALRYAERAGLVKWGLGPACPGAGGLCVYGYPERHRLATSDRRWRWPSRPHRRHRRGNFESSQTGRRDRQLRRKSRFTFRGAHRRPAGDQTPAQSRAGPDQRWGRRPELAGSTYSTLPHRQIPHL